MSAMRSSALLFFILMVMPTSVFAAAPTTAVSCFMKDAKNPSETKVFSMQNAPPTIAADIRNYMTNVSMCPSACWSEVITMNFDANATTITVKATPLCGNQPSTPDTATKLKIGCTSGFTAPRIQVNRTGTVKKNGESNSRCDTKTVLASLNTGIAQGSTDAVLQKLAQNAASNPNLLSTPESRDQAAVVLKAFGVSDTDAKDLVENNPDNTKALLQAFASGDQAIVQQAADNAGVTLNPDLSNIESMSAQDVSNKFAAIYNPDQKKAFDLLSNPTTGFTQPEPLVLDATGQPTKPLLPGNRIDPGVLGSIAADAQKQVCSSVQGTCFVTKEAQFATMMNESTGNVRTIGDGGKSMSLGQVYLPTANGLLDKYKSLYGEDYVLNRTDIRNENLNPEWIASQSVRMQALVLQQKGEQTGGDYNRILSAYNGGGYAAAIYGTRALVNTNLLQNGNASPYWQAAYNSAGDSASNGPAITNLSNNIPLGAPFSASPFGNVNPLYNGGQSYTQQYGSPFSTVSTGGPVSTGSPVSTGNPVSTGGVISTTNTTPVATVSAPAANPVASIIVQPVSPLANNPITVSWSSFGMQPNNPCRVLIQDASSTQTIKQSNEGSQVITASHPGTFTFTMQCLAIGGASIQQATSVSVR